MNVVVTGGAGFIGSHLCEELLKGGYRVTCIDNLITGNRRNIEEIHRHPNFSFVEADVSQEIPGNVPSPQAIIHLASPASPKDYLEHPIETLLAGSKGTLNCLEWARRCNASFLLGSTSEVYGDPEITPQVEEYPGRVNPIGPRSVYDESKRFSETATMAYHRKYGLTVKIVRIFNTYGPRMRPTDGRVVPAFITQALRNDDLTIFGDGTQTRSFCYVSDTVRGLILALQSPPEETGPFNIGNPDEITILQLAEEIIDLTGSSSGITFRPLPRDDPKRRRPDITKARCILGWEPTITRKEGLKKTIEFFRRSER